MVIKANATELAPYMSVLHSIVMENRVEIVCMEDDMLVKSEVMRIIRQKSFKRLMLVFTKANYCSDQEMDVLANAIGHSRCINSLKIYKLNATKYNSDVSLIVIVEETEIIVMSTGDGLAATRIIKLLNKVRNIILCTGRMNNFTGHDINEIVDIISKTTKLERFAIMKNSTPVSAMKNVINCLSRTNFKTADILNNLNTRNFDFTYKGNISILQTCDKIDKQQWDKIFHSLINNVDLRTLDLSGNTINKEVAQCLSCLLNEKTKIEDLVLNGCSLGVNLKYIPLQKITTLSHLDLSNNNITNDEPLIAIIKSNTKLEKLFIEKNCLHSTSADKLSTAVASLRNLEVLSIDQSVIKIDTAFPNVTDSQLVYIYNHDYQSTEKILIAGSLHNITTLTLFKAPVEITNVPISAASAVSKTGVLLSAWRQDDSLSRTEVRKFLSTYRKLTTMKFSNISNSQLTDKEEDTIATVISKNTQLENILFGSQSYKSIDDDCDTLISECNIDSESHKPISPSKNDKTNKPISLSLEFLFKIIAALKYKCNLKALDLSGNVITEELSEQLSIVLANCTKLETLSLEDCSLGNEGVNVIGNSLKNITTLKNLDLSNNNITEESHIVRILEVNTGLEKIGLEKNCLPSTAGDKLSVTILSLKNLKELSIDQNIINRQNALKFATAFSTATDKEMVIYNHDHQNTEVMDIRGPLCSINTLILCKHTDDRQKSSIKTDTSKAGTILLLWVQSNNINTSAVLRFLSSLRNITTIEVFNDSELTELEVDTIATVISENVQLENVLLGNESLELVFVADDIATTKDTTSHKIQHLFSDKLLFKVLSALQNITNLKTLDLSGNVITEELSEQLAIVLANCTKLETLLLEDCSLCNEGVNVIGNSLKNITALKNLDLSNNNITEESHIVRILKTNTGLEQLHLMKNCLPPTAGDKLSIAIVSLKNLKELSIDQNIISRQITLKLATAFSTATDKKLVVHNHDHQTTEVMYINNPLCSINTLIMCKHTDDRQTSSIQMDISEAGRVLLLWVQSNIINTSAVLRFLSSLRNITTIKVFNDSELTELEVDTIATVIS